jgi:hypothetical protein
MQLYVFCFLFSSFCEEQWFTSIGTKEKNTLPEKKICNFVFLILDDLKALTKKQWECLNLPLNVCNVLQNALTDTSEACSNNMQVRIVVIRFRIVKNTIFIILLQLRKIVFTAGMALNRSPSDLVHVCEVLAPYDLSKQYNTCSAKMNAKHKTFCSFDTLDAIEAFSKEDWLKMKLPLRLFEEILVQIQLWKQRSLSFFSI